MFEKNKKKNKGLGVLSFLKKDQSSFVEKHEKINIERQWEIAFMAMTILGLVIIAFEIYLFVQIDTDSIFANVSESSIEVETLDVEKINKTLNHYRERSAQFDALYSLGVRVPEPLLDPAVNEGLSEEDLEEDVPLEN